MHEGARPRRGALCFAIALHVSTAPALLRAAQEPLAPDTRASTTKRAAVPSRSRAEWTAEVARGLVERGARAEARGDLVGALAIYVDALRLAPQYGPGYLALARLHLRLNDPASAERMLDAAARDPTVRVQALAEHARLVRSLGNRAGALAFLEMAVSESGARALIDELIAWYSEEQRWTAALALQRRQLVALGREGAPSADLDAARDRVRALARRAAETDGVTRPDLRRTSWTRRSLAHIAAR